MRRHRKSGIGLAMICHAIENMKQRGIQRRFADWVALDGWWASIISKPPTKVQNHLISYIVKGNLRDIA
jgi:hypothetical protein